MQEVDQRVKEGTAGAVRGSAATADAAPTRMPARRRERLHERVASMTGDHWVQDADQWVKEQSSSARAVGQVERDLAAAVGRLSKRRG